MHFCMVIAIYFSLWLSNVFANFLPVTEKVSVGTMAPAIVAVALTGDTLSLEKLRGNIVLVDFWASWNQPSRQHNLTTLKLYERYRALSLRKKKKFVVIQISLDTKPDLFDAAVRKDNLYWRNHLCDFKGWRGHLVNAYGIQRLPANFLIDTSGMVVAKDVWESTLDKALQQYMQ
jgi:thiol-disulfide isomerase/thioredoxin